MKNYAPMSTQSTFSFSHVMVIKATLELNRKTKFKQFYGKEY